MATALLPATDVGGMLRPSGHLDIAAALRPYDGPWTARLAGHLLRRAGFGGSPDDVRRFAAMRMDAAVDSLLHFGPADAAPPSEDIYDPRETLRENFAGTLRILNDMQRRDLFKQLRMEERRSLISIQNWWLNRMLSTQTPLQEKMALYFHGHFTTAAIEKGVTPPMIVNQNRLFRRSALGNLRDLTWQVSIDPAMLLYLDNARSDAGHPNENYARELMELFTLGVDHYAEKDVRESARAWTGWTVARRTGDARFVAARHDAGTKTFLGKSGNWNGRDIVDIIYDQPACAEFWANSLLNFFVYNDPEPELIEAVASVIRKNDYNLQPILSTLLRSNVFYSARAYRALVKSPVEFVVGAYKALNAGPIDGRAQRALVQMGQILFYPPNVAGWPGGANWLTSQTAIARENFVASLVNSPVMEQMQWMQSVPLDAAGAAAQLVERILLGDASPLTVSQITAYLDGAGTSAPGTFSAENFQERVRGAAYLTMAMPAYQLS